MDYKREQKKWFYVSELNDELIRWSYGWDIIKSIGSKKNLKINLIIKTYLWLRNELAVTNKLINNFEQSFSSFFL